MDKLFFAVTFIIYNSNHHKSDKRDVSFQNYWNLIHNSVLKYITSLLDSCPALTGGAFFLAHVEKP